MLALGASTAAAQSPVAIRGRVVERGSGAAIAGAVVELSETTPRVTDADGRFRFEHVAPGRYALTVQALGWSGHEAVLQVRADTTLLIEMDPAPIPLDTLNVESRVITMRGRVRERGTSLGLVAVEVLADPDRRTATNVTGRFRLERVPAGPPIRISLRGFGYLPLDTVVAAFRDTTLALELDPDPLVQRMIDVEVAKLEKRSRPFRAAIMPPMDRAELLRNTNLTVLDLLRQRFSIFLRRVQCILIDDVQNYNGLDALVLYFPDELERIEVLERGAMLRIYTREYIRRMIAGEVELPGPLFIPLRPQPHCR